MRVIEGQNVDLIDPFPIGEVKRLFKWLYAYKTLVTSDESPQDEVAFQAYCERIFPGMKTYGIIDKYNRINSSHEAPLVGYIGFEITNPWNLYAHVATPRRSWKLNFAEEGGRLALNDVFNNAPNLLRVSAMILRNNAAAKGLIERLGFEYEGTFKDMIQQGGVPKTLVQYSMLRGAWDKIQNKAASAAQGV